MSKIKVGLTRLMNMSAIRLGPTFITYLISFFVCLFFSKTGFLCVIAPAILELTLDQVDLILREIFLPLLPECWN